ncbi:MAG: NUDIX domain-containing protein [Actinomycetota bacterium]|nr:NUDIX domain-containing protein [Actinomycetota bacterium]
MRYRACIDVHLILRRGEEILLGQRHNTGFADGCWHLPSGHAEGGESATAALIREAAEEIGVRVDPGEARFVHLMHHQTDSGRIALSSRSSTGPASRPTVSRTNAPDGNGSP